VNTRQSRSVADPFVIALAHVQGLTMVTAERASGSPQKPRIPDVCAGIGVKCVPLLGMFKERQDQARLRVASRRYGAAAFA
jgi:hypothetical protein